MGLYPFTPHASLPVIFSGIPSVIFSGIYIQAVIEGYPHHLESACQSLLGYAGWLAQRSQCFKGSTHATHCLIGNLVAGRQPYRDWQYYSQIAAKARYVSPFEKALRLIYEVNQQAQQQVCDPKMLDALSDPEIAALLPQLEWHLRIEQVKKSQAGFNPQGSWACTWQDKYDSGGTLDHCIDMVHQFIDGEEYDLDAVRNELLKEGRAGGESWSIYYEGDFTEEAESEDLPVQEPSCYLYEDPD